MHVKWRISRPAVFSGALILAGCGADTAAPQRDHDSWYQPPPEAVIAQHPLEPFTGAVVTAVADDRTGEALAMLTADTIVQLSPAEVRHFAGRDVALSDVSRPFLVRALYRNNAQFDVAIVGAALWIASRDTGADQSSPAHRGAVILLAPEVPETVYVSIGGMHGN